MGSWFEVSKEGLASLQKGKPKYYIIRELVQNAWDEDTQCLVDIKYGSGRMTATVEDNSPIGFRNLADAYTLFGDTYKRSDPEKRGRFNLGEKQAFSVCNYAEIETTKGTVIFDKKGRTVSTRKKRESGTKVTVVLKATGTEVTEIVEELNKYLVPKDINFVINGVRVIHKKPIKVFNAKLLTEKEENKILKRVNRETRVELIDTNEKWLYELGIPVQKIDCKYSINVNQKVPLGIDRESVLPSYLSALYAEVLNNTYQEITSEDSSKLWIREATSNDRVVKEAVINVVKQRFGDKAVVANPFDKNSIDEAISKGYNVVYGSEMSKEEWDKVKEFNTLPSSTDLFGKTIVGYETIKDLTEDQKFVADFAKRIAKRALGIDIKTEFIKSKADCVAQFGDKILTFNLTRLHKGFFSNHLETLDLIVHELGHYKGSHTEHSYHECITKMAQDLVIVALKEPEFYNR